jgi:hypothetical protein
MATSVYFNNFSAATIGEQRLMEDVIGESIKIMGHDVFYLPREAWNEDDTIFGENTSSKFERAYVMEMYLANVEGYEGDGDFFSKFGLEIRDSSNFVVGRRAFEKYVPSTIAKRPREGDLIYIPVMNKIFEIKFVEEELMFFSLGKRNPYIYELRCEMFRYSNENINTGVEDIDIIEDRVAYTIELDVNAGSGNYFIGETVYQGANLVSSTASAEVKNWDPQLDKLYLINIVGTFAASANITGVKSNTVYNIAATDVMEDNSDYDLHDNKQLQTEADNFIDFTEVNPFGRP